MQNYKKLKVWQKAINLSIKVYAITKDFPKEEIYSLTSQIRRCAISIPSNIAEGAGRRASKDFNHFLDISLGSSCELDTQLLISAELNYIKKEVYEEFLLEIDEIQKMINGLQKSNKEKIM